MVQTWFGFVVHDVVKYLLAAGLVFLVVTKLCRRLAPNRRLQPHVPGRRQVAREIVTSLRTAVVFASVSLFGIFVPAKAGWGQLYDGELAADWPYALFSLGLMILAQDAYFYWTHRAMHHPRLMRLFHVTHHRSRTPTPWTAYAMDVGEALVHVSFAALFVSLVPTHQLVLLAWSVHMIVRNAIGHSGVEIFPRWWVRLPLLRWITTVTHHDLHHETGRWNYGLYFTWWDSLMGTEHPALRDRFARANEGASDDNGADLRRPLAGA